MWECGGGVGEGVGKRRGWESGEQGSGGDG